MVRSRAVIEEAYVTISELGDIGDFIASVGVIASLIFVGMQMRASARLTRAASRAAPISSRRT